MGKKGEDNRQRIIDAADQLFFKRGFNQTSFQDISDATGIPRGNFYYYFKTKEDILDAVLQVRRDVFIDTLKQIEANTGNPLERLMQFADMLDINSDDILASGCPIGSLSTELAKGTKDLQEKSQVVFQAIKQWASVQFSAMGVEQADDAAMDLLAWVQGVTVMACAFKDVAFLQRSLQELKQWLKQKAHSQMAELV